MQYQTTTINKDKFDAWWRENEFKLPRCPISDGRNWSVAEHIVEFRQYHGGHFPTTGSVYPAVMMICQDCGYTIFINAVIAGLV
jgi:hypothetical protein